MKVLRTRIIVSRLTIRHILWQILEVDDCENKLVDKTNNRRTLIYIYIYIRLNRYAHDRRLYISFIIWLWNIWRPIHWSTIHLLEFRLIMYASSQEEYQLFVQLFLFPYSSLILRFLLFSFKDVEEYFVFEFYKGEREVIYYIIFQWRYIIYRRDIQIFIHLCSSIKINIIFFLSVQCHLLCERLTITW